MTQQVAAQNANNTIRLAFDPDGRGELLPGTPIFEGFGENRLIGHVMRAVPAPPPHKWTGLSALSYELGYRAAYEQGMTILDVIEGRD